MTRRAPYKVITSVIRNNILSCPVYADYTIQHAYNIQNLQSVTGVDDAKIVIVSIALCIET